MMALRGGAPELAEPGGGLGWFNDITVGGPGLVAVGTGYVPPGEPAGGEDHAITAAVWTSPDGLTWTRVPHDPDVFGSGILYWSMDAVAVGGPGLVAVGTAGEADNPWNPAVWTSPDGLSWTLVPPTELPGDEPMFDVVAGGPGLVAVGGRSVWTSPDGLTWTIGPPPFSAHLWSVTSVGSELVAVGSGVWTSVDGVTWTEADLPGVGDVFSVAATDDRLIAVGAVGRDGGYCTMDTSDCAAAVWIATEG